MSKLERKIDTESIHNFCTFVCFYTRYLSDHRNLHNYNVQFMSSDYIVCLYKQVYVPILYPFTTSHIAYIQQQFDTYIQHKMASYIKKQTL